VSQAVNVERVRSLSGTSTDLVSPDYRRLKEQLAAVRSADEHIRFIYLLGRAKSGDIFFYVDNEPADSEDYSPPGQLYEEASEGIARVFDSKDMTVEGPVADDWGVWVTALVPIIDPASGNLIAALGMDIDAHDWRWQVAGRAALPLVLTLMLIFLLTSMLSRTRTMKTLRENEKRLTTFFQNDLFGKIIVHRASRNIFDINDSALRLVGLPRDKVVGNICHQFVCPAEQGRCPVCDLKQTVDNSERVLLDSGGKRIPILKTVTPIVIEGDDYLLESFIDISDRKRADEEVRLAHDKLSIAVEKLESQKIRGDILTELRQFLQATATVAETGPIVEKIMLKLFPASNGAFYLMSASRTDLALYRAKKEGRDRVIVAERPS